MKNIAIVFIAFIILWGGTSCEKIALDKNPSVDNESIYNEYWKIFNERRFSKKSQ